MSSPSTYRQYSISFALLCLVFAMIASPVSALTCWSGSSRDAAFTERVCDADQTVCELDRVRSQPDLYGAQCALPSVCQRNQDSLANAPTTYIYSEVVCCTEDLCNDYPGQNQDGTTPTPGSGSVSMMTGVNLLGALVLTLAHQLYHNLF